MSRDAVLAVFSGALAFIVAIVGVVWLTFLPSIGVLWLMGWLS